MKTRQYRSLALSAGFALGLLTLGGAAGADETFAPRSFYVQAAPAAGQQRVASTTQRLEEAFNDQFVRGRIDRDALSGAIDDVVEAMPEAARPRVRDHIDLVLVTAEKLAAQLAPEQRAEAATPPAAERVGKVQQAQIAGWGWPGYGGWGGYGAFGFPAMYSMGYGYGTSYGTILQHGHPNQHRVHHRLQQRVRARLGRARLRWLVLVRSGAALGGVPPLAGVPPGQPLPR